MGEDLNREGWTGLSTDQREFQILEILMITELDHFDPVFTAQYTSAKSETRDHAERMRLDIEMVNRVVELRQLGKMQSVESLKSIASSMVNLSSDDMRNAFAEFSRSLRQFRE